MSNQYRVQNPMTNEIVETFDFITDDALEQALSTADDTFKQWRERSYEERAEVLHKIASLFDDRRADLARIIAEEMGKSVEEGDGEVDDCVEIFNYYADNGAQFGADQEIPTSQGGTAARPSKTIWLCATGQPRRRASASNGIRRPCRGGCPGVPPGSGAGATCPVQHTSWGRRPITSSSPATRSSGASEQRGGAPHDLARIDRGVIDRPGALHLVGDEGVDRVDPELRLRRARHG